jgi:hypothetical protein
MMDAGTPAEAAVRSQAKAYGEAVYHARAESFEEMCHERFHMTLIGPDGATFWDKAAYLERVRGRSAFPRDPSYEILDDRRGGRRDRARASLGGRAPVRYEDHLGFVKVDGQWKLLTKVFRTMGPAQEG